MGSPTGTESPGVRRPRSIRGAGSHRAAFRKSAKVDSHKITDVLDGAVGARVLADQLFIQRVMALSREDGGYATAPGALDGSQDTDLVVDEDVVIGGIARFDVVEFQFLVDVDQHGTLKG